MHNFLVTDFRFSFSRLQTAMSLKILFPLVFALLVGVSLAKRICLQRLNDNGLNCF